MAHIATVKLQVDVAQAMKSLHGLNEAMEELVDACEEAMVSIERLRAFLDMPKPERPRSAR
jgi:hypothetical protein